MKGKIFQIVSAKFQYRLHSAVKAGNLKNRFLNQQQMSFHWWVQQKEENRMVKPDNIPTYLKEYGSWCDWKFEEKKGLAKVPYNPKTGNHIIVQFKWKKSHDHERKRKHNLLSYRMYYVNWMPDDSGVERKMILWINTLPSIKSILR